MNQGKNTATLPDTGFLRLEHILGNPKKGLYPLIPISKSKWYQGVRDGVYPQSVDLHGVSVWRVEDIRELIDSVSESNKAA